MVAEFRRRRDVIVAGLNDIPGISCLSRRCFLRVPEYLGARDPLGEPAGQPARGAGVAALGRIVRLLGEGLSEALDANSIDNIKAALEAIRAQLT